jgi:hypothetical protein
VTLKVKFNDFEIITRSRSVRETELASERDRVAHGVPDFVVLHRLSFEVVAPIILVVRGVLVRRERCRLADPDHERDPVLALARQVDRYDLEVLQLRLRAIAGLRVRSENLISLFPTDPSAVRERPS